MASGSWGSGASACRRPAEALLGGERDAWIASVSKNAPVIKSIKNEAGKFHLLQIPHKAPLHRRIINIGSEVVDLGNPQFAHYVAAKAAMVGLTRSWAVEFGGEDITVNLVAPGMDPGGAPSRRRSQIGENDRLRVALGDMGRPDDVAAMVAFLASPEASFITAALHTTISGS